MENLTSPHDSAAPLQRVKINFTPTNHAEGSRYEGMLVENIWTKVCSSRTLKVMDMFPL